MQFSYEFNAVFQTSEFLKHISDGFHRYAADICQERSGQAVFIVLLALKLQFSCGNQWNGLSTGFNGEHISNNACPFFHFSVCIEHIDMGMASGS